MNSFRFELVRHQGIDCVRGSASVWIQILVDTQNGDYAGQAATYHCTENERQCIANEAKRKEYYADPENYYKQKMTRLSCECEEAIKN